MSRGSAGRRRAARAPRPCVPLLLALVLTACAGPGAVPPAAGTPPAPAGGAPAAATAPAPTAPPQRPPLRATYVAPVAVMAPLWMAKEGGFFERYNVPVEMGHIQANAAVAALLAGEVDLLEISGPPVLSAALQGADIGFIAGALNKMIFSVQVAPDVHSPQDLKGKLFGTDRPGTPVAFGTEVALQRLGLQPTDVQLLNIGSSDQLLAALLSGQLAAAVLAPPASFTADDAGYHQLINLYDVPYQNVGFAGRPSALPPLEASLVPFLRAVRDGIDLYNDDKALAVKVIQQYTDENDPMVLDKTYEFYKAAGFNRSLDVSEAGIQSILGFLAQTVPAAQDAQPGQFFDDRYVRQLQ